MTQTSLPPTAPDWTALLGPAVIDRRDGVPVIGSLIGGGGVGAEQEMASRISPASGQTLFHGGDATDGQVDRAVATARAAFDTGAWGKASGRERSLVLAKAASLMAERAEQFAQLLILEAGKPIREARGEVAATINALEYFSGLARDINGRTQRDISADLFAMTVREPAGVAGLIIPWNFPLAILGQKLPPALAAGCAVVAKPSPLTPLSTLATAVLLYEAGLDPDVLFDIALDRARPGVCGCRPWPSGPWRPAGPSCARRRCHRAAPTRCWCGPAPPPSRAAPSAWCWTAACRRANTRRCGRR